MKKLRVLIADDHAQMLGYIAKLCGGFEIVGAVSNGEQLVRSAICLLPDVVVSDIQMPKMSGVVARMELIALGHHVHFVFVSAKDKEVVKLVPKGSPVAFVYKGDMALHLGKAIKAVIKGESYLSPLYRD